MNFLPPYEVNCLIEHLQSFLKNCKGVLSKLQQVLSSRNCTRVDFSAFAERSTWTSLKKFSNGLDVTLAIVGTILNV